MESSHSFGEVLNFVEFLSNVDLLGFEIALSLLQILQLGFELVVLKLLLHEVLLEVIKVILEIFQFLLEFSLGGMDAFKVFELVLEFLDFLILVGNVLVSLLEDTNEIDVVLSEVITFLDLGIQLFSLLLELLLEVIIVYAGLVQLILEAADILAELLVKIGQTGGVLFLLLGLVLIIIKDLGSRFKLVLELSDELVLVIIVLHEHSSELLNFFSQFISVLGDLVEFIVELLVGTNKLSEFIILSLDVVLEVFVILLQLSILGLKLADLAIEVVIDLQNLFNLVLQVVIFSGLDVDGGVELLVLGKKLSNLVSKSGVALRLLEVINQLVKIFNFVVQAADLLISVPDIVLGSFEITSKLGNLFSQVSDLVIIRRTSTQTSLVLLLLILVGEDNINFTGSTFSGLLLLIAWNLISESLEFLLELLVFIIDDVNTSFKLVIVFQKGTNVSLGINELLLKVVVVVAEIIDLLLELNVLSSSIGNIFIATQNLLDFFLESFVFILKVTIVLLQLVDVVVGFFQLSLEITKFNLLELVILVLPVIKVSKEAIKSLITISASVGELAAMEGGDLFDDLVELLIFGQNNGQFQFEVSLTLASLNL
mmetsp:Transcript_15439/g.13166  ORF Transcript_15439/g.13166 Transcript_15439/m.13166 type:complete len:598 (-) Transcript_15439:309-2102(-)